MAPVALRGRDAWSKQVFSNRILHCKKLWQRTYTEIAYICGTFIFSGMLANKINLNFKKKYSTNIFIEIIFE